MSLERCSEQRPILGNGPDRNYRSGQHNIYDTRRTTSRMVGLHFLRAVCYLCVPIRRLCLRVLLLFLHAGCLP